MCLVNYLFVFVFSYLGNEDELDLYEFQICVKDYCFVWIDNFVGMIVFYLRNIVEMGLCVCILVFGCYVQMDFKGWIILKILL